jgi:DUF1365 family protein
MTTVSAIYTGSVAHTRLRPVRHRLRYRMLALLIDLDEVQHLSRHLSLFSAGRFNLFGFRERDHLDGTDTSLRVQVERLLVQAGLSPDGGPIRLLAMPRVLGAAFNPLSVFFCHGKDGAVRALIYQVNNTFGQRHSYLIPVTEPGGEPEGRAHGRTLHQRCSKHFYVSPFMDMAMQYHFRVALPSARIAIAIEVRDTAGAMLSACFAGERRDLTDANLLKGFLRNPLPAAHVLGGIHWEALKLWRKGMRIRPRPAPPESAVSIVLPTGAA